MKREEIIQAIAEDKLMPFIQPEQLAQIVDFVIENYQKPMPNSTQLVELWHEDKEMLKEKDFRGDQWRLAYNAFLCGFGRGFVVKKQEQPSLPSNLDEAAEKYSENILANNEDLQDAIEDAFKAGAEWVDGQGQTLDSLIWMDEDDKLFIEAFVDENRFKMAENVTIQIRKKQ